MFTRFGRLALVATAALSLSACGINSVPTAEENALAKWADVESSYQRRSDLIPNLLETVKAGATSEEGILTQVTESRSKAGSIQLDADDLNDPAKVSAFQGAQGELGASLGRLMVVVEAYPDLKSQQGFRDMTDALEGAENRINTARDRYNEAVRDYNTTIRTFPDIIGANIIHGAERMEGFSAQEGSENAVDVDFSSDEN